MLVSSWVFHLHRFLTQSFFSRKGHGAFAVVARCMPVTKKNYIKAWDPKVGVAIKFILKAKLQDKILLEREIEILGRVTDHPGICTLFEVWELEEAICLVQEFIPGKGLEALLAPNEENITNLKEQQSAQIIAQVLIGLQYCHQQNVCHRDLKPDNIIYDKSAKFAVNYLVFCFIKKTKFNYVNSSRLELQWRPQSSTLI